MITLNEKTYVSPKRKLLERFSESRDGWKDKCAKAKRAAKALANNVAALQRSREKWKAIARQRRDEVEQLQRELEQAKNNLP